MRRIFVEKEAINGEEIIITGDLVHHLGHVLRLGVGEQVMVCTGDGQVYVAELMCFSKTAITGRILQVESQTYETKVAVTLYQGMPKGDKLELIVQKCTELGVSRIVPVFTQRSVVKLDATKGQKKTERWQKIAQEASQQAERVTVPEIVAPLGWAQMLAQLTAEDGLTLVLWEDELAQGLKAYLTGHPEPEHIRVVIGPEGGLATEEVAQLREIGAVSVTLGKRILRTETAGLAALAMIFYQTGDLG